MSEVQAKMQTLDEDSIASMRKYLEVLIESFPTGLTQKELAEKANVSPSAVSKIKEKLFPLCNVQTLAFESRLVLEPSSEVLRKIAESYLKEKNLLRTLKIVSTSYGERVIRDVDVHKRIVKEIPIYGAIFSDEETRLMTTIFLRFARSVRFPSSVEQNVKNLIEAVRQSDFTELEDLDAISIFLVTAKLRQPGFEWPLSSEQELHILIALRDKVFHVLRLLGNRVARELPVYRSFSSEEKKTYKVVCEKVIDYYLEQFFRDLTTSLESTAEKKNLSFDQSYRKIGSSVEENFIREVSRML